MSTEQIKTRLKNEIECLEKYNVQYWPIYTLDSDTFIGCCGLRPYDIENNIYELDFHISSKYCRLGYTKEAAVALIKFPQ